MHEENSNVIDFAAARLARRPIPTPCPVLLHGATARIHRPIRNVRQRGRAPLPWLLEFDTPAGAGGEPLQHVCLRFPSREQAIRFAQRRGWKYSVEPETQQLRQRRPVAPAISIDEILLEA